MSSYASIADLRLAAKPSLFFTDKNVAIPDAVLQRCLDDATDEMNTHLRSQNKLPFTSWGNDVIRRCCDIALWYMMLYRGFSPEGQDVVFRQRYEDALNWLHGVATGMLNPDLTDSTPEKRDGFPSVISGRGGNYVGVGVLYSTSCSGNRGW